MNKEITRRIQDNVKRIRQRKGSKMSKGEKIVAEFLMKNGIEFKREWFFNSLFVKDKGRLLYFDFYIPGYKLCIEFDGEQHYTGIFNGKKQENLRRNDFLKTAFCIKNGFKLLRIKFSDIERTESIICEYFDKHF